MNEHERLHGVLGLSRDPSSARLRAIQGMRNEQLAELLLEILDELQAAGIRALPIKGPVLAETYYGDVGARTFTDLDILIDPEDLERTLNVLTARGGRVDWAGEALGSPRTLHAIAVEAPGHTSVEVHTAFGPRFFGLNLEVGDVLSRARPATLLGRPVSTPAPRDLVIYLCHHGTRHGWDRLIWHVDIARVLERDFPGPAVEDLLEHASRIGCRRLVLLGAALAHRQGAQLPPATLGEIATDRAVQRNLARVQANFGYRRDGTWTSRASRFAFNASVRFDARERARDRARDACLLFVWHAKPRWDAARELVTRRQQR